MKITKKQYDLYKEKLSKMEENGIEFLQDLETKENVKTLSKNQSFFRRNEFADEIHFYKFQIFRYELSKAFNDFDISENIFLEHEENSFSELVDNNADKMKGAFEIISKLGIKKKKLAQSNFETIQILIKYFPKHPLNKKTFPLKNKRYDKL